MGEHRIKTKTRVKLLTSTKGSLLEEKINETLEKLEDEGFYIMEITTNISYSGERGYMILAMIEYVEEEDLGFDYNIDDLECSSSFAFGIDSDPEIPEV